MPDPVPNPTPTPTPEPNPTPNPAPAPEPAKTVEPPKPSLVSEPVALAATDIKLPEGFERDDTALEKFVGILNNKDLTGATRAQALIDLQAEVLKTASEKGSLVFTQQQEAWQNEVRADPEIGGAKLDENLGQIAKLVDNFGTPKLREVFDTTGAGNHPEMVRFLSKLAKVANEANLLPAGTPQAAQKTQAQRLYPSMTS